MLDQEEHSAETETGERGEVIKGRTELDGETGRVQNRRRGEAVKGRDSRLKKQGTRSEKNTSRRRGEERGESSVSSFCFFS